MTEEVRKKIYEFIPKKYFVDELFGSQLGHLKVAVLRKTINPFIDRSTDSEASITLQMDEKREVVEVPPRKFKSREKLLGLKICRKFGVVDEKVRYNMIQKREHLNNPNSILFGDSVTQEQEAAGLPSRAIYDWAYSIRDVKDITDKLQHNALSEEGTMWNEEEGTQRQSLFMTEYILPETFFPHFITLENITPELLIHLLYCVSEEKRYGAQTTTNAPNFENKIIGIYYGDFEKAINSYIISKGWEDNEKINEENIVTRISSLAETLYGEKNVLLRENLTNFLEYNKSLWQEQDKKQLEAVYKKAHADCDAYVRQIKLIK